MNDPKEGGFVVINETDTPFHQYLKGEWITPSFTGDINSKTNTLFNSYLPPSDFAPRVTEGISNKISKNYLLFGSEPTKIQPPKWNDAPQSIGNRVIDTITKPTKPAMNESKENHPTEVPAVKPPPKSKNSIFDLDHKIEKPICQMTDLELQTFKGNLSDVPSCQVKPVQIPSQEVSNKNSISVPLSLPVFQPATQSTPNPMSPKLNAAFLGMNTSLTNMFAIATPLPEIIEPIFVSFFPTSKNCLGEGQYSKVYKGTFTMADSDKEYPCAVKRMHRSDDCVEIVQNETKILAKLKSHPNIIKFIALKNEDDVFPPVKSEQPSTIPKMLLILEYCEAGHLWNWMMKHPKVIGRKLWFKWAREISSALAYMHSCGIIHHDIKPHNLLLTDLLDIRIADFGNASVVSEAKDLVDGQEIIPGSPISSNSQDLYDGMGLGTPAYSAPELLSPQPYSFPVDIYSTGIVFYTLLSYIEPFPNCKSSMQMMMMVRRGFFQYESQGLVLHWKNPDPTERAWCFSDGEAVPADLIDLIVNMVDTQSAKRPTAKTVFKYLDNYID
ncbi:kinase-like domain-containing protein [Globomyces pollinis-pini]|nr:kinase-like domain-containing protein [Globomyces pollinis-pini]